MGNIAANGGPVAYNGIGNHGRGVRENGIAMADQGCPIELRLSRQGTDMQYAIELLNILQIGNAVDIDQDRGCAKTKSQNGDETLASCQDLGLVAMLFQQGNSFRKAFCRYIIEGTRNQMTPPTPCKHGLCASSSLQSKAGVERYCTSFPHICKYTYKQ